MKTEVPAYIIKYIECSQQYHDGEKVNIVCLNSACSESPLICSLCKETKHNGHPSKPLKIYLDELYKRYKFNESNYNQQLEELQKRKFILLLHLKTSVERIAEEFSHLEEDIITTYETIKNQIHDNEYKRSKFEQFYLSMIKDNFGDPHFEVKNYLFKEEIQILTDQDIFQSITATVTKQIQSVKSLFLSDGDSASIPKHNKDLNNTDLFLKSANILKQEYTFSQTDYSINARNMVLLDVEVSLWTNKLRVTILDLQAGGKLSFGVIKKEQFNKLDFSFNDTVNCLYLDSLGKNKGAQSNYITNLGINQVIDFFIKKNNFRATCKNSNAIFNLADKKYFFFFVLEGKCKVKITYPYFK